MDLRLSDGRIAAGRYRTIVARGHTVIDPGVVFDTLVVAGVVAMVGCRGGTVECRAGRMVCTGNMDVRAIVGYGEIHVSGRLSCRTLRFVGVVRADGRLVCARDIAVDGILSNGRIISAASVTLRGVLESADVRTDTLSIEPLHSMMLTRHAMGEYTASSHARTVVGGAVRVHALTCVTLHADAVELSERCRIERLCNASHVAGDGTADVSLFCPTCSQTHLKRRGV